MQLKIQFGQLKNRKLIYPDDYKARPTLARSRDVLFNWVYNLSDYCCLDLFAGTGILGIEALSLGAQSVDFTDIEQAHCAEIKRKITDLHLNSKSRIIKTTAQKWLLRKDTTYDLIFVDPPFDKKLHEEILQRLCQSTVVTDQTLIFLESPSPIRFDRQWELIKEKKIGKVRIYLIKRQVATK